MKIRTGFVSNSSSSSFTCDICGAEESGRDLCLSNLEWFECEGGHTISGEYIEKDPYDMSKEDCIRHFFSKNLESWKEKYLQELKDMTDEEWEDKKQDLLDDTCELRYCLPSELCPICSMQVLSLTDKIQFLIKKTGITKSEVFKEVKQRNKRRRKLYDSEYIDYVQERHPELTPETIKSEAQQNFKTYEELYSYLWG